MVLECNREIARQDESSSAIREEFELAAMRLADLERHLRALPRRFPAFRLVESRHS